MTRKFRNNEVIRHPRVASDVLGPENSDSPTPIFISTPFIGQRGHSE